MEHIIGKLLQDYEHGKMTRRQLIQSLAFTATAASAVGTAEAAAPANAIYINHVSMQVADYAKSRDFYTGLFGMKVKTLNDVTPWRQGAATDSRECKNVKGSSYTALAGTGCPRA